MAQTAVIHARIDPSTKEATERILDSLGLTPTEAIRLFYRQIAMRGEFPLELRVPNKVTAKALRQADRNTDVESFDDVQSLYDSWEA
jgi:DNA-damage-inducible protein J